MRRRNEMKSRLVVVASWIVFMSLHHTCGAEDTWQDLFDGKSLEGWRATAHPESFHIQEGAIAAGGGPMAHLVYVGPVSNHDFRDFELKMDVKALPGSNGGVFFHTEAQEGALKKGYEAQICDAYPDKRKTGSLVDVKDIDQSPVADGEWFEYSIRVHGKKITIAINDQRVVEYEEPAEPKRKKGRERRLLSHGQIALQAHDPKSMVFYKNIQIKIPNNK